MFKPASSYRCSNAWRRNVLGSFSSRRCYLPFSGHSSRRRVYTSRPRPSSIEVVRYKTFAENAASRSGPGHRDRLKVVYRTPVGPRNSLKAAPVGSRIAYSRYVCVKELRPATFVGRDSNRRRRGLRIPASRFTLVSILRFMQRLPIFISS